MAYDNICKLLATQNPLSFARWLLPQLDPSEAQVLQTELAIEPIRADSLILLQVADTILHLEFERLPQTEPPLPERMLDYWLRLYRRYHCRIEQAVIFLKPTSSPRVYIDRFQVQNTSHRYRVIRLWEEDPAPFFADPWLLPLAPLTRTESPRDLLEQVAEATQQVADPNQRRDLVACAAIMSGLIHDPETLQNLFGADVLEESSFYQFILNKGRQEGRRSALQEGQQQEAVSMALRLLNRQVGTLSEATEQQVRRLSLGQLEALMEALLDFSERQDLQVWLASLPD